MTFAVDVLCVGETMALVAPAAPESLQEAGDFIVSAGGAESTVAMHLAALGHRSAWAGRLGDDPLGRRIRYEIASAGVDVSSVALDPDARTGVYFKDPGGVGRAVFYYRDGSAASRMSSADAPTLPVAASRILHLSGITPALSASCAGFVDALLSMAEAAGTIVSFDVNYRAPLWRADAAEPLLALCRRADIVFVGEDEAHEVWGIRGVDLAAILPPRVRLIVKDGAVGAAEHRCGTSVFVPTPPVDVVEAIGAGDAFAAGYLAAFLGGADAAGRLETAHRIAARSLGTTRDFAATPPNRPTA